MIVRVLRLVAALRPPWRIALSQDLQVSSPCPLRRTGYLQKASSDVHERFQPVC